MLFGICMYKPTTAVWQPSASFLFKLSVITSAVAGIGLTTGCTSTTPLSSQAQSTKQLGLLDATSLDSLEDLLSATDMRAVEGDRLLILKHGDVWKRMTVGFKMDETKWDPRIEAQRSWFITRQPYLDRLSARASRYLYHTVKEAERRGMPTELALLPVIESSYDPAATSSAAAAGMWQFIPSTGKIYGLRQNSLYDGRRDVVESTRAAYEFLGSLYNQFGSWELALAAYNAGPGRIQQAINRNKAAGLPTDYWSLRLPEETMNYVPRFLAVAQIIKSPHKYGVNLPPIANRPHFREISIPAGSQLSQIASITGLSRAELYQLNPGHRGEIVDAQSTLKILIPADLNPAVDAKLRAMKPSSTGYLASAVTSTPNTVATTSSLTNSAKTVATSTISRPVAGSSVSEAVVIASPSVSASSMVKTKTPSGSSALAAFAASSVIPSAPRIPVAVTPAKNIQPVLTEPKLTDEERAKVLASINPPTPTISTTITTSIPKTQQTTASTQTRGSTTALSAVTQTVAPTSAQTILPTDLEASLIESGVEVEIPAEIQATQAEKEEVVREITALAPQGTEIVDPLDGKIKLTAIQTSQSIAAEKGQELKVGFSYPKSVAENTSANSEEAKLNSGKSFVKTESEVVVARPTGKRSTYIVSAGDTLAVIAMKNGLNWRDIAKWNQVDPTSTLYVGTSLYLYDAKPVADKKLENKTEEKQASYVVKPNDNLSALATQFNLTTQQLADYNNLSANSNIFVGQKLSLIDPNLKNSDKKSENRATAKIKTKVHTVKRGEFLKLIADRYALSNQELAALTADLKPDSQLMVGQKINVPLDEVNTTIEEATKNAKTSSRNAKSTNDVKTESYTVERGDTLYSIANKSKLSVNELAEINSISVNRALMIGQSIQIPAGTNTPSIYIVQSGDSLNAVAGKYNLSVNQIATLNGLSASAGLFVGQKLKLSGEPDTQASNTSKSSSKVSTSSSSDSDIHVVVSGETLASIARKYKLQLDYLLELNDLTRSSSLQVGQRLKVESDLVKEKPTSNSASKKVNSKNTEEYTVKAGESLNIIASRIGLTAKELADLNGLKLRSGLQRGQMLQIPKTKIEYKIRSGDTLHRIASRYGIETSQLAEMNDLKLSSPLQIGDTIQVPNL